MKCGHCGEPIHKGEPVGACPVHGQPGRTLPRGARRCTVCAGCYAVMTAEAPLEPVEDTRPSGKGKP